MIGLGKMGFNMARRLMRAGHRCVGFDVKRENVQALQQEGGVGANSLEEALDQLRDRPRIAWVMLPAGEVTEKMVEALSVLLEPGDILVDGGNSHFKDDVRRQGLVAARGIEYVDVGTSGGVWGAERGYCLMIGGSEKAFAHLDPVFQTLAPGDSRSVRAESGARLETAARGYLHCGPCGAGHFVKMIHNGIEYGMMQAFAEGFEILRSASSPSLPKGHRFEFDLPRIAEVWRKGSVISSWLLDLAARALSEDPALNGYTGYVEDSGEGRWTVQAAIEESVPADVLSASLFARFRSRQEHSFANKMLSAMRHQFGGHVEPARRIASS